MRPRSSSGCRSSIARFRCRSAMSIRRPTATLRAEHGTQSFQIRSGTALWHGDKALLHLGADVLDVNGGARRRRRRLSRHAGDRGRNARAGGGRILARGACARRRSQPIPLRTAARRTVRAAAHAHVDAVRAGGCAVPEPWRHGRRAAAADHLDGRRRGVGRRLTSPPTTAVADDQSLPTSANVLHWSRSPEEYPRLNQDTRCSAVPCVKVSGSTRALRLLLDAVVAHCGGRLERLVDLVVVCRTDPGCGRRWPRTPAKQSACSSSATEYLFALPGSCWIACCILASMPSRFWMWCRIRGPQCTHRPGRRCRCRTAAATVRGSRDRSMRGGRSGNRTGRSTTTPRPTGLGGSGEEHRLGDLVGLAPGRELTTPERLHIFVAPHRMLSNSSLQAPSPAAADES